MTLQNVNGKSGPSSTSSPNTTGHLERTVFNKVKFAQETLLEVLNMMQHNQSTTSLDDHSKFKVSNLIIFYKSIWINQLFHVILN